jgi:hypothetical protein
MEDNKKMQELATKYVRGEITMTQYVNGINEIMRKSASKLESVASLDTNYAHKNKQER